MSQSFEAGPSGPPYQAIVLAGGRGSRLGGVDKAALAVEGRSLLELALRACRGAAGTVVVGPGPLPSAFSSGVLLTREEPPYAGPAAAAVTGLRALQRARADLGPPNTAPAPDLTLLLACDHPLAEAAVAHLLREAGQALTLERDPAPESAAEPPPEGWCLVDSGGRRHWLLGLYRTPALARAAEALGDPTDQSLGRLLGRLRLVEVPAPDELTADVDRPEDIAGMDN